MGMVPRPCDGAGGVRPGARRLRGRSGMACDGWIRPRGRNRLVPARPRRDLSTAVRRERAIYTARQCHDRHEHYQHHEYHERHESTNVTYRNRAVPGAVVAVPREAFVNTSLVNRSTVRIPVAEMERAPIVGTRADDRTNPRQPGRARGLTNSRPSGRDPAAHGGCPARTAAGASAVPSAGRGPLLRIAAGRSRLKS